ncbi:hypothetical protein CEXT_199841 [Caerostris extrusa]|uniref:Uncharacterized protein n=1 Tax=Caerostris extrusa TaxID=172846 RepID=A0AAV4QB24_CAEEX|nr:hypothetical protein CEXT_199841 [Caerostris extrusa]
MGYHLKDFGQSQNTLPKATEAPGKSATGDAPYKNSNRYRSSSTVALFTSLISNDLMEDILCIHVMSDHDDLSPMVYHWTPHSKHRRPRSQMVNKNITYPIRKTIYHKECIVTVCIRNEDHTLINGIVSYSVCGQQDSFQKPFREMPPYHTPKYEDGTAHQLDSCRKMYILAMNRVSVMDGCDGWHVAADTLYATRHSRQSLQKK